MAFPTTPTNGQITTINGITYTYSSSTNSWSRTQQSLPTLSVNVDTFIGNGSTTSYTLNVTPASKEVITVNIDGILQQKSAYNLTNNVLSLTGTPINGAVIEVKTMLASNTSVLTGLVFDTFTGDGTAVAFMLSTYPTNKNFTLVAINGVTQSKSTYSVIGNALVFNSIPAPAAAIEVTTFGPAISSLLASGSTNQIQLNNNGSLAGYSNLTFDNTTNTLSTGNINATGNLVIAGNISTGNVTSNVSTANTINVGNINITGTFAGNVSGAQTNITSVGTLTGLTVNGLASFNLTADLIQLKTGATGVVTHDVSLGGIFYHTTPAANFTANFTNLPVTNNRAILVSVVIVQGSTPYVPNAVQIDGASYTLKWYSGSVATGNASKTDVVTFSLLRVSNSWTVFAQLSNYA